MENPNFSKKRDRDETPPPDKEDVCENEPSNDSKRLKTDNKLSNEGDLSNGTHGHGKDETPPHIPPMDTNFVHKKANNHTEPVGSKKKKRNMIEQNEKYKQQPLQWVCEYCERALFDTREEACDHEKTCPERPKLPKDEKRKEMPDKVSSINNASPYNCKSKVHNEPRVRGADKIQWVCEYCEDAVFDTYQGKCILLFNVIINTHLLH